MGSTPDTVSTTDSTTDYLKLRKAINTAIQTFSDALKEDTEYVKILTELTGKIDKVRTEIDATLVVPKREEEEKEKGKKSEPESASKKMSLDEVNTFINSKSGAIFVVTGGSFNPPHNGHIGMFQKAYDALIKEGKIKTDDGKKVYGVMVPAPDSWIENKLCKEEHPDTKSPAINCNDDELTATKAAIELKRIKLAERVNLCKLSCDSYNWTDSPKFNASNMIVVNEGDNSPATSILQTSTGFRDNAYYLCGSDYYAGHGTDNYKFICVLRKGVTLPKRTHKQIRFDDPPITGDARTSFVVKDTDIIIEDDGGDNDASSTMLRNILTKIRDAGDYETYDAEEPIEKKLLTKQVYCELLNMKYIVGDKGMSISQSLKCGDDKAIIPMKLTGKAPHPNKDKFIKDLADSFEKCNSSNKSSFSLKEVTDILNNVYTNGHYMLLNDIHFMNTKSSGQPLIFQLMSQKNKDNAQSINSLKYFTENKFEINDTDIYPLYKEAFDALSNELKQEYETLCKFLFETERNAILFQILRVNEAAKEQTSFAGIMKDFYHDLLTKESDTRDGILGTVGYTFKSAYGDGNCFYNSAGMQLIAPMTVDKHIEYDKLARNEQWQAVQFNNQTDLRTALAAYLKKLYVKLQSHSNFAKSENITIKYLRTNGGKDFVNVSTIKSGIGPQFWGTDDELYFIAALYDCFIVILPSNDTNFQTIEYTEKIDSDETDQDKLFKALSEPSIPIFSPSKLITKLDEVTSAKKQIIFMLGGKGHWDYAIPSKT